MTATCTLGNMSLASTVTFDIRAESLTITLQLDSQTTNGQDRSKSVLSDLVDWIADRFKINVNFEDLLKDAGMQNFNFPVFRRLVLAVGLNVDTGIPSDAWDICIDVELGLKFGVPDAGKNEEEQVVFLFTYKYNNVQRGVFRGSLWGRKYHSSLQVR